MPVTEGDTHNCCCEHVVEHFIAMPGPKLLVQDKVTDKYMNCPHRFLSPLEQYLWQLAADMGDEADLTGVDGSGEETRISSAVPDPTVGSLVAQVGS